MKKVDKRSKSKHPEKTSPAGKNAAAGSSKNALEKSTTARNAAPNKVIELGIFVDQAAMGLFMPYVGDKEYEKLRELVLAFVNAVSLLVIVDSYCELNLARRASI